MKPDDLDAIACDMKSSLDLRRPVEPIAARTEGFDIAAGYAVARRIHQQRLAEGATSVGRKIGFTNRAIWPVFGVYQPIWAHVYDTTVLHLADSHGRCALGRFADPRIEPEIVLHFRSAPPLSSDPAAVLACIDWIAHGFEIVQSPFPDWKFQAPDAIAASGLHAALLVGEHRSVDQLGSDPMARLEQFHLTLSCNAELRDRGQGANVLGGPLSAVIDLIATIADQPDALPLRAGDLVTTGTLTAALSVSAGETWSTQIEGIGLRGMSIRFES